MFYKTRDEFAAREHIGFFTGAASNMTEVADCFTLSPTNVSPATNSGEVSVMHFLEESDCTYVYAYL